MSRFSIGQYVQGESVFHRADARTKLVTGLAFMIILFVVDSIPLLAVMLGFAVCWFAVTRVGLRLLWKSLRPMAIVLLITSIINLFFVRTGREIPLFWGISIYEDGVFYSVRLILRLTALVASSALITCTTSPVEFSDAFEFFLAPLRWVGIQTADMALTLTIALRFIPTFMEETDRISEAQKGRGADLDTGSLGKRIKAAVSILVPLFVSAFRRADGLALAMESRCYTGGPGRTRMKERKLGKADLLVFLICAAFLAAVTVLDSYI
ncbi:MAG: energy-coupling factor transporter transmembrane component T family protein [Oscillospiraceae bacterium]|jgi:energy-coupling factor transport system permease protein